MNLEGQHQAALFTWARAHKLPPADDVVPGSVLADYLFAIPNGGSRHRIEARNLKLQGVKRGVSDMFLPLCRGGAAGLWIELKTPDGEPTAEQTDWIRRMSRAGYRALVAHGWDQARTEILKYLAHQPTTWSTSDAGSC